MHHKTRMYIIISFCVSLAGYSYAQDTNAHHIKYNHYRNRLYQKFIAIDTTRIPHLPGTCIPVSRRNETTRPKKLTWGEGTVFLSNYIQVLATEYKLKKLHHIDCSNTLRELYFAMETYSRLDITAEPSFRDNTEMYKKDLNGFFIRDDIPKDILLQFPYLTGYEDPSDWSFCSNYTYDYCNWKDKYDKEMSQDQVWHLLLGFSLVNALVDTIAIDYQYNFRFWSQYYSKLMITCLQGQKHYKWKVQNPVDQHKIPQRNGGKARIMCYGFSEAGRAISSENIHKYNSHNIFWKSLFFLGWFYERNFDDDFCFRALSCVADLPTKNDFHKLMKQYRRKKIYKYPQFPLIYAIVHDSLSAKDRLQLSLLLKDIKPMLDSAPDDGPCSECGTWSATNLLVWPENAGKERPGEEYNGLDYMLLHNLYYLLEQEY